MLQDHKPTDQSERSQWKVVLKAIWDGVTVGFSVLILALAILVVGVPAVVGGIPLTVLSGSMQPMYQPRGLIVVRPTEASEIRVGDIITYQLHSGEPELVTHRVQQRSSAIGGETTFITKGDSNPAADENPVREVQVLGTVWYRIPWLGWVNNIITGNTRQWLIPLVAGGLFIYAAWNIGLELRRRISKKPGHVHCAD